MFEHYGLPSYIAGMNVSAIAYKTDRWNISRLDNSFQLSGVMVLDGEVDNEQEAYRIVKGCRLRWARTAGRAVAAGPVGRRRPPTRGAGSHAGRAGLSTTKPTTFQARDSSATGKIRL